MRVGALHKSTPRILSFNGRKMQPIQSRANKNRRRSRDDLVPLFRTKKHGPVVRKNFVGDQLDAYSQTLKGLSTCSKAGSAQSWLSMCQIVRSLQFLATLLPILINSFTDSLRFLRSLTSPRAVLAAEKPVSPEAISLLSRTSDSASPPDGRSPFQPASLVAFCDWRSTLVIVKPETLIGWHRKGLKLFWKQKSRPRRRPRIPVELRQL